MKWRADGIPGLLETERSNSRRLQRRLKPGQSTTELAAVLPLAMILLFGVVQFGLLIYAYSFVAYAASTAARYASVNGADSSQPATASSLLTYVEGLGFILNQSLLGVTPTWNPNNQSGSTITIQITYRFQPFAFFLPSATIKLSSTASAIITH